MRIPQVHPSKFDRSRLYLAFILSAAALLVSGCVGKRPPGTAKMVSYEMVVAERVKRQELERENQKMKDALREQIAAYQELERKIAMVQLRLMKNEIENKEPAERLALLQKKLDEAIQEVVRTKAKLRSMESKAGAASSMAEAEIALKDLKAAGPGQAKDPEIIQAEHLLRMSALEFKDQNYSGALYLTSQVKSLVKMAKEQSMSREKAPMREAPVSFFLPVPLQVLKTSNVREGPGLDFKVLFTLKKDSTVIGHSYRDQWVRVKSKDGRDGWIFYTLVDGR